MAKDDSRPAQNVIKHVRVHSTRDFAITHHTNGNLESTEVDNICDVKLSPYFTHFTCGRRNFCPCKMLRPNGVPLEKTSVGTCLGK